MPILSKVFIFSKNCFRKKYLWENCCKGFCNMKCFPTFIVFCEDVPYASFCRITKSKLSTQPMHFPPLCSCRRRGFVQTSIAVMVMWKVGWCCLHSQCIFHLCAPAAAGTCQGGVVGGGWQKGVVGGVGPQSTLLSPIQLLTYNNKNTKINFQPYIQKRTFVEEMAILAKKNLRKKCVNRDKM